MTFGEALTENVPDSYRMGVELMLGIKPCKWFQWDINATWSKNRIQDFVESLPGYHYNEKRQFYFPPDCSDQA